MNHFAIFRVRALQFVMGLAALSFVATAAGAGELTAQWKNGLSLSDDAGNSIKFGGRIFNDWAFFSEDDDYLAAAGPIEDGTEFRTTRLFASGTLGGIVEFKSQIDFAKDKNELKDMYLGLKRIPGTGFGLRVGRFKQPFGLEELTSSKYTTFMERSVTASFAPSRQSGVMLHGGFAEGSGTMAASFFRDTDAHGKGQSDGQYSAAGRLTFVPWSEEDSHSLLHLGASAMHRNSGTSLELALEPEAHLQPDFGNGLDLDVESWNLLGGEAAVVMGPFSLQGEVVMIQTAAVENEEDASFGSYYVQGSYFLTGESRAYKASSATFDRVKPSQPMTADGGRGALELAARYSSTDLNDGDYAGGTLDAITLGANWYLNNNARVMLNYVRSDGEFVEAGVVTQDGGVVGGVTQAVQARFQIDF